jgi:phosphohistidine phosphatase
MKLYLVQHAQAKSKQEDPERPLAEQGWIDIRRVATFVAQNADVRIRQINHSGKTRAKQTAEVLAETLYPLDGVDQAAELEPMAEPSVWAKRLASMKEDVMLVGHLPHLSKLAALLTCQDELQKVVDFQMGGVVCLFRDKPGVWSVRWMVTPEIVT